MDIVKFYIFVFAQCISTLFSTQEASLSQQLVLVKNVHDEIVVEHVTVNDSKSLNIINDDLISILVPAKGNQPEKYYSIQDEFAILKASFEKGNLSLKAYDKNNTLLRNL